MIKRTSSGKKDKCAVGYEYSMGRPGVHRQNPAIKELKRLENFFFHAHKITVCTDDCKHISSKESKFALDEATPTLWIIIGLNVYVFKFSIVPAYIC